jgi:transcriptional regulator with XRE-family HTH domain
MGGEGPNVRLSFVTESPSTRRRPTEQEREATRLTTAIVATLGRVVRSGRQRKRLTQGELADLVGVDQTRISQIELGRGDGAPLGLWVALGVALDQPLAASFSRPLGETREPPDAGHLAIQEHLLGLARRAGRTAFFELPTRPADPSRSIDVCVRDPRHRVLIVEEAWNTFGDIGGAIRSMHKKQAEAQSLAATMDDGRPYEVVSVWVVRASATNRALIHRYPEVFASAFPGSSRAWVYALTSNAMPPADAGLVWSDPANARIFEWRRPMDRTKTR